MAEATAHLRPNLIPVLRYPDGTFRGETTTLAYDLEARHAERSVIPDDKALAFVCDLLEDLADEWAVKALFLYRWWDSEDQAYVSRWVAEEWSTSEAETGAPRRSTNSGSGRFRACLSSARSRRTSRCWRRATSASSRRSSLMSASNRYLFGSRPSLADFAWFGQLSEMATDPTPMRILREKAPFTDHWVRRLDDASGVEGVWYSREQALTGMTEALLQIAGELYLPFLLANADAFAKGQGQAGAWKSGACLTCWRRSNIRSNAWSSSAANSQHSRMPIEPR